MQTLRVGIDVGSTTIKWVIINGQNEIIYKKYQRHRSEIQQSLLKLWQEALSLLGDQPVSIGMTGSGAVSLAERFQVPFVQEVTATARAINRLAPQTDVAIELGGEDAKILYFLGSLEQRMNGVCAGGTGSFLDQMAALLQTDTPGLNTLAKNHTTIYPIASRCGVFAKTDIQPLINEGAAREDLAASIFQAVVNQTVSGLACGKPIRGHVAFLGGPLTFLPELRNRFAETLHLTEDTTIVPENSQFFAAIGAAFSIAKKEKTWNLGDFGAKLSSTAAQGKHVVLLPSLFSKEQEYHEFLIRHNQNCVPREALTRYRGNAFLGIDAGSTTTKLALLSEDGKLLHSFYASNGGGPLPVVQRACQDLYKLLPPGVVIRGSCATGYGEGLMKEAIGVDWGYVETVAHYKAAHFFYPEVDFILDIGGQDMKCINIKNGAIENISLNEACSSGCGSFFETFAASLGHTAAEFAELALFAKHPIELGSRCTVFMNSRVKQAQKEGANVADIAAGLVYSVIKNALYKVLHIVDPAQLGNHIVVQGGAFYNNALLRCFEQLCGKEVVRPDVSGLMGAFGAALIAIEKHKQCPERQTSLLALNEISSLTASTSHQYCGKCTNHCLLTEHTFSNGRAYISGNRCERGVQEKNHPQQASVPNLFAYKKKRLFSYASLTLDKCVRGTVGIPRVLNMWEDYPFWHTFFTKLGYRVVLSPFSTKTIYELGMESIPSDSACYPAKLVHGHIQWLLAQQIDFIFYPGTPFERPDDFRGDQQYHCPMVASYSENIKNNMEELRTSTIPFHNPFLPMNQLEPLKKRLKEEFSEISWEEISQAADLAWAEWSAYREDIKKRGEEALQYIRQHHMPGIVLAGRPYHADPEINHGIPEMIASYHIAVFTEDAVAHLGKLERPLQVRDQWVLHSRMYQAAAFVRTTKDLEYIQMNSFGCGLDAVTTDEIKDILTSADKLYTALKIDEVQNLGAARIRIRSLLAAMEERRLQGVGPLPVKTASKRIPFTKKMKKEYTILCPQLSPIHFDLFQEVFRYSGFRLEVMPDKEPSCVDTGLKYVNNDACYPALIVVGQLLNALLSKKYDVSKTAVLITQTGGGCRASNYISFLRRALKNAHLEQVPVISFSPGGIEKNPGFSITPMFAHRGLQAMIYGDLFQRLLLRVRPYEKEKGAANTLYLKWREQVKIGLRKGSIHRFHQQLKQIIQEFDNLPVEDIIKPKVGVVGEILVKYNPTANNDIISILEKEGAEVVVPDLAGFPLYSCFNGIQKHKYLGAKKRVKWLSQFGIWTIAFYQQKMIQELKKSKRFSPPAPIGVLAEYAKQVVSLCNQTGEGWFLTGEMAEMLHNGINHIICVQPFGCLPNHIVGKGVIKELRRVYPLADIIPIDYDPGASEVNQLNRIRLLLENANQTLQDEEYTEELTCEAIFPVTIPLQE